MKKFEQITEVLENSVKKGTFTKLVINRPTKLKKAFKNRNINKVSEMVIVLGIDYENKKSVRAIRETGKEPSQNWFEHVNTFIVKHRSKDNFYLRVFPSKVITKTKYLENGKELNKDEFYSMCLASEKPKDTVPEMLTLSLDNIQIIEQKGTQVI